MKAQRSRATSTRRARAWRGLPGCFALCACLAVIAPAWGSEDWQGSNTLRLEHYEVGGDPAGSPYASEGAQVYDELDLRFRRRFSPYRHLHGQATLLANDSVYRSPVQGLQVERLRLDWQDGEGSVPYRLEAGDQYGYFSAGSLQRTLKGVSLDLQPRTADPGRRQSLVLLLGAARTEWRDFRPDQDLSAGLSYVLQAQDTGGLAVNLMNNRRQADPLTGAPDREQWVWSLAGQHSLTPADQRLDLEGEWGLFDGDHDGAVGAAGQDREDSGGYLQLAGRSQARPLTYRLRLEQYGGDYRPAGAAIAPDRQAGEAHAGWTFASGLNLRGRWQAWREAWEGANPIDTRTAGLGLGGPLWREQRLNGHLEAFVQDRKDALRTVDQQLRSSRLDLTRPFDDGVTGRLGLTWLGNADRVAGNLAVTRQLDLGANLPLAVAGGKGWLSPGAYVRHLDGPASSDDAGLTLAAGLDRGAHGLSLNMGLHRQDPAAGRRSELASLGAAWRYRRGRHSLGADLDLNARQPDQAASTEALRIAVFWTAHLERPARPAPAVPAIGEAVPILPTGPAIAGLLPGTPLERLPATLDAAGLHGGSEQAGLTVFEFPVLSDVVERQRLALVKTDGELDRVVLVILPDDPSEPLLLRRAYERVLERLLRRWGTPGAVFDEGEWNSPTWAADLAAGRFSRVREWRTPDGVLRFGLPRRLDGQVRFELVHAKDLPPIQQTLWGLEALP